MGGQTAGLVQLWQVSNEMDIRIFRGPMTVEQAARFLKEGSLGVKEGDPEAETSINPAGLGADGRWLFENMYAKGEKTFDYAGIDGYFGFLGTRQPRELASTSGRNSPNHQDSRHHSRVGILLHRARERKP
jgi:hypothetical protein